MYAEIVAVGSELTSGAKLDTNSQWLSVALGELGIPVRFHVTVADDLDAMVDVLRTAVARSDLVLITGGLGPTQDDLTRDALAALAGRKLVLHQPSLEHIRRLFARRGRPMPERNRVQALFPEGAEPLPNPIGTAPGIWLELPRDGAVPCRVAALPGVPSEMRRMFREQVQPRLSQGDQVLRTARLNCFGAGESAIEQRLGDLTARGREPEVGITAHEATIVLRITARAATAEQCQRQIDATKELIRQRLGDLIFGEEDQTLQDVVVSLLNARGKKLATLETGTDGLLSHWLAQADPGGRVFVSGQIEPASVGPALSEKLRDVCSRNRADLGLAAFVPPKGLSPSGGPPELARVLLLDADREQFFEEPTAGNPAILAPRVVKSALNRLRLHLMHRIGPEVA